jgi:hypothetical protein
MLYREFVLRSPAAWQALAQLVAANAKAFIDRGRPLRVIVTEDEKKRTSEANRFYWGAVLTTIAEQAWVDGRQFSKDVWHEHFARLYLPHTEIVTPYGEIVSRRKSTTELTVSEFSEYLQRVQSDAASTLGVQFD